MIFRARTRNGVAIEASGGAYLARGPLRRAVEMAAVEPGSTARMRVVFDTPMITGPITISDGTQWATATMPAATEPLW